MKLKKLALDALTSQDKFEVLVALGLDLFEYRFFETRKQQKLVDKVWHDSELFPAGSIAAGELQNFPTIIVNHIYAAEMRPIGVARTLWEELLPYPLGAVHLTEANFRSEALEIRPEKTASVLYHLKEAMDGFESRAAAREVAVLSITGDRGKKTIALQFNHGRRVKVGTSPLLARLAEDYPETSVFERELRSMLGAAGTLYSLKVVPDAQLFRSLTQSFSVLGRVSSTVDLGLAGLAADPPSL